MIDNKINIAKNIQRLRAAIEEVRLRSPMATPKTELLGASKSQPPEILAEAIEAGLTLFGENRVQEAQEKWAELKIRYPNVELHLIGPLQSNKAKEALSLFDVIETLDRPKLAEEIARIRDAGFEIREKRFFIQVNTGEENQKAGIMPKAADAFIDYCKNELRLNVTGLMCVPPVDQPPAPHFALLREISKRHDLHELSMGMSEDFETAIRMGSTCVRLGRAIFGERK